MPSPRPTRLQPGDRCWWNTGANDARGTVEQVTDQDTIVWVRRDRGERNGGLSYCLPAGRAHPLYDDLAPNVVGSAEVAKMLGVSRQMVTKFRRRIDFPTPTTLACGPIWNPAAIRAWNLDRKSPRDRPHTRALASFRKLSTPGKPASVYAVAKSTGIPYSTTRRHLVAAGVLGQKDAPQ